METDLDSCLLMGGVVVDGMLLLYVVLLFERRGVMS